MIEAMAPNFQDTLNEAVVSGSPCMATAVSANMCKHAVQEHVVISPHHTRCRFDTAVLKFIIQVSSIHTTVVTPRGDHLRCHCMLPAAMLTHEIYLAQALIPNAAWAQAVYNYGAEFVIAVMSLLPCHTCRRSSLISSDCSWRLLFSSTCSLPSSTGMA